MPRRPRLVTAMVTLALVAAACGSGGAGVDGRAAAGSTETTGEVPDLPSTPAGGSDAAAPEGPSALDDPGNSAFPDPLVPLDEIVSGGPPPDGIPAIDEPEFVSVGAAEGFLEPDEPIVYLAVGDDVRAYPARILIWHEIVNDVVGGTPVAVTYCPLCNSAITYVREVGGRETTFGTSGKLFASALVMYDRRTESLWTHFDGRAVVGVATGEVLESLSSPLLSWAEFRDRFPDGRVLDPERTGFDRDYGSNPYVGYDDPDTEPFLFLGDADARARAKQRVVGVSVGGAAVAWTLEAVSGGEARATNGAVGDTPIVILWKAGQATALEGRTVAGGRDVGSVGVFAPVVDGRPLTFAAEADGFRDEQTGSTWTVTGRAVAGPLDGAVLEPFVHLDTFWFAWATYRPGTDLIGG